MGILKWALIGGGAYLGIKALTGTTTPYAPGDANVAQLVEAAKVHLDWANQWTIAVEKTGAVALQGKRGDQIVQAMNFPSVAAALAWVTSVGMKTGKIANVTFYRA